MTLEELTAAFSSFKEVTNAALLAKDTEIGKLKGKTGELIGEKKKLKAKLEAKLAALEAGDDVEDDEPAPKGRKGGRDDDGALARIEAANAEELARLKKELDDERAARNKAVIDAELIKSLDTAGIKTEYRAAVLAMIKSGRKVEVVGGDVRVDGKKASDSVAEWARTSEGSAFVAAPANGGSATPGASSGSAIKPKSQMTRGERGEYIRIHGATAYGSLPA